MQGARQRPTGSQNAAGCLRHSQPENWARLRKDVFSKDMPFFTPKPIRVPSKKIHPQTHAYIYAVFSGTPPSPNRNLEKPWWPKQRAPLICSEGLKEALQEIHMILLRHCVHPPKKRKTLTANPLNTLVRQSQQVSPDSLPFDVGEFKGVKV